MQQVIETGLKSTEQSEVAKMARVKKKERQQLLVEKVKEKPFLTDEELAKALGVSVQTIRLDRLELGIPELRGRIRKMAETAQNKVKSIQSGEVVGELIDLELGHSGISLLRVTEDMVFAKTQIAKGHYMFSQANSLALAIIDAPMTSSGSRREMIRRKSSARSSSWFRGEKKRKGPEHEDRSRCDGRRLRAARDCLRRRACREKIRM